MLNEANHKISFILVITEIYDLISLILMLNKEPLAIVLTSLVRVFYLIYQEVGLIGVLSNKYLYICLIAVVAGKYFLCSCCC